VAALAGTSYGQSVPLSLLDVPFISQSEALCGGAAAAMVLRYWGERGLNAESFAHLLDRSAAGIRTQALLSELRSRGWTALALDGTDEAIDAELQRGRPVLTLIQDRPSTFHYIVIVGTTPAAIVFHDPARAPLRVVSRAEFSRRWQAAGRWMAVVVPGGRRAEPSPGVPTKAAPPQDQCSRFIADGIERAQAKDLDAAERNLTNALSCGGATAMRELAGVRVLQQRWADAEALSEVATTLDPQEPYGWRLLGTSRFVQNDVVGALQAWNHVAEPRLDVWRVDGLVQTRQRVVERLIGTSSGSLVTPRLLLRSERRLRELPSASSASVAVTPRPDGVAELRATVNERPLVPADPWSYAGIGLRAASRREAGITIGSLTGGGERVRADWRFWPGRPRIGASIETPAPWGGVWSANGLWEREQFTAADLSPSERSGGFVQWSNWIRSIVRLSIDLGVEDWDGLGSVGRSRVDVRLLSPAGRMDVRGGAELWRGADAFSRADVSVGASSATTRRGRVFVARAGAAIGSANLPPALWFAGDTGVTRQTLLRAHPVVNDGRLRVEQLGRNLVHASGEAQRWWGVGIVRAGAAVFVDAARTGNQAGASARGDVDAGIGLRLALPGTAGTMRADVATGLAHGGTRWSFVYEP
jgi:peptidase C39-like protein